jgi:hypothetical protein
MSTRSKLRKLIITIIGIEGVSEEDRYETAIRIAQSFIEHRSINATISKYSSYNRR